MKIVINGDPKKYVQIFRPINDSIANHFNFNLKSRKFVFNCTEYTIQCMYSIVIQIKGGDELGT